MTYILLIVAATLSFIFFTFYLDRKTSIDTALQSTFSITMLTAAIESVIYLFVLIFKNTWLASLAIPLMKLVFVLEGVLFVNFSFSLLSMAANTRKPLLIILKYALYVLAIYIAWYQFKTIDISNDKGIVIASNFLFDEPARNFFPWDWVLVFNTIFKFILPVVALLFVALIQEKSSTQIQRYQTLLTGEAILFMWIIHFFIMFISTEVPSFSLLFPYSYVAMFIISVSALGKQSVPSGKGLWVFFFKVILSYIIPAFVIGFLYAYFQPTTNLFESPSLLIFIAIAILGILYSLKISEVLSSSSKIYTADYEGPLEKELASINYQNAGMDEITNKMNEILKKNIEASSVNVYILSNQNELETAYSSNKLSLKIPVNNPIFDNLLNNNRNVVIAQQIEKDHTVSAITKELSNFFEYTKSDALFILNEGHNIFGLITLGKKVSGDHYKEYDYNVFTKLYSYFFVFGYYMRNISNKDIIDVVNREIKMSSQIITSIQENIDNIKNPKVDTGYLMVPSHNIGGEFIDLIRLTDTRHLFVVGDLSGKGIAASMNMVILKSIIRTYLSETHDFKELVTKVNTFVRDSLRKGTIFAGLFALVDFETDTMYYINCGIPALMMYTQVYNNVIEIQGSGHVLGFVKDISPYLSVKTIKLNRGDIILACTDGLINSHSLRGEQFGKERVQQALLDNSTYPAQRMAQFTFDSLLKFMSKEMEDDVSILILKYEYALEYYEEEEAKKLAEQEALESENVAEGEANAENQVEEASAETENDVESTVVESTQSFDSFEIPSQEVVEEFNIKEASALAATEQENKSSSPSDDMGLPEGFDMSTLDGLDDLLNEAGL